MANAFVSITGFIFILLCIAYFFSFILIINFVIETLDDFIAYMDSAFLNMFSTIENGVVEFFDVLYEDVVELIDELIDDFTPYF